MHQYLVLFLHPVAAGVQTALKAAAAAAEAQAVAVLLSQVAQVFPAKVMPVVLLVEHQIMVRVAAVVREP